MAQILGKRWMKAIRKRKSKGSAVSVAANRRGTTYRPGRLRRTAIVDAAEEVLMQHGHAQFTVQRVALKLGISPGNVNYYFPTRASLLEALILRILAQYRWRTRTTARPADQSIAAGFDYVLRWQMEDSVTERTDRLFRQLWAIAGSDERVAHAMDSFYTRSVRGTLRQIGVKPSASAEFRELESIMYLVQIITEGTSVIFGTRPRSGELLKQVQSTALRAIGHLVASVPNRERA
jgi:AcrR family transcriptional regulator